ncbi:hypothetical protein BLNAU_14341 [Blattamonas nauphoetae]|uniref:Uncharacterized protein n=1 Tax=Blattamonas nauphoetae TaxID=2049346 RepID=A0ABQ9XHK7_9EUKA|nr:hypothetical protein BLNAU_14341 [Blattamonas nauphoetae]
MKILNNHLCWCSEKVQLALIKTDLIPRLINTLNPQSLSFAKAADIRICLLNTITWSVWLATPNCMKYLGIEDLNEQQAVHETVLKQVLVPSEKYIWHLCVNRFSIIDEQSKYFLTLLAQILRICPYYQPTMDFVLQMPVVLTIPSCLTFFEIDESIWTFLDRIIDAQLEWNKEGGEIRQMGKTVHRMLRMEGNEDAIEAKLRNEKNGEYGELIVAYSIQWNNMQGMNIQEQE